MLIVMTVSLVAVLIAAFVGFYVYVELCDRL